MATLSAKDVSDLVIGVLDDLGRLKFQQIAQNLAQYEVFPKWFKKDKVVMESGLGIKRTLMNKLSSAATHVGLTQPLQVNITDVLDQLEVPWRHARTHWALIYQTDLLMNSGKSQIVNTIKARRAAALINMVEELEDKGWACPAAANKTDPFGLPYWIVQNATAGFNGALPSDHSTIAGVSLTDSPGFKNYSGTYAACTKADLIKKARTAHRKVRFKSPITIEDYRGGQGEQYRIYVNETLMSSLEDVGEGQQENLGRDIASMDGTIVFRKHPIIWIPKLDAQTNDPWYMVDHSTFMPVVLRGDYLRETDARQAPDQDNVWFCTLWLTYNYLCVDRRRNAVIYKA